MDVRRVLDLADVRAVVGEFHLSDYDGGIAAQDVTGPKDSVPENAVGGWILFLLEVKHLQAE